MLEVSVPIAYELLAQCIKQGQALIQRASLVGDFSDYESWKSARKQWIDPTVQALEHMYGGAREARDFADTVTSPERARRWQEQYAADVECVKGAIEFLTLLQGELAFDAERPVEPEESATQPPRRDDEIDAAARAAAEQLAASAASAAARETEPEHDVFDAPAHDEPAHDEPAHDEPPAVGAQLAARPPLASAELAQQADLAVPTERVETSTPAPLRARKVYLASGRDERWKQAVAHLLEQAGSDELTILDERPEERTRLLEHGEEQLASPRYAVVLLTADDIGAPRLESAEEPYFAPRARQEVVFEMGFLVAALTAGRVCVLYEEGVELPCELDGISHVRLDLAGTWQPKLLMKLRRAGFDYDLNRLVSV